MPVPRTFVFLRLHPDRYRLRPLQEINRTAQPGLKLSQSLFTEMVMTREALADGFPRCAFVIGLRPLGLLSIVYESSFM